MNPQPTPEEPFVSYAQNAEDVVLWRALREYGPGFYIDVGAADPIAESVTKAFYERGWRGINVEPMPLAFELLRDDRERDINLELAVESETRTAQYYSVDGGNGLSSGVAELAHRYSAEGWDVDEIPVRVTTLADICREFVQSDINFLKIDVEGMENEVLAGADFKSFRPWVVLVEATEPGTRVPTHDVWEPTLVDSGYELALFDGLNRFYVATEKSQLLGLDLSTPANVFDNYVRAVDLRIQRALRAEADELQTRIDESSRKHSVLADQLDDAHQKLYEASRRISALGIDLQTASTRASAAEQQARERLRALERHVEELQALYATASWRATRPLRALALRARALRTRRARSD